MGHEEDAKRKEGKCVGVHAPPKTSRIPPTPKPAPRPVSSDSRAQGALWKEVKSAGRMVRTASTTVAGRVSSAGGARPLAAGSSGLVGAVEGEEAADGGASGRGGEAACSGGGGVERAEGGGDGGVGSEDFENQPMAGACTRGDSLVAAVRDLEKLGLRLKNVDLKVYRITTPNRSYRIVREDGGISQGNAQVLSYLIEFLLSLIVHERRLSPAKRSVLARNLPEAMLKTPAPRKIVIQGLRPIISSPKP